jgi:hypothetical protein
MLSGLVQDCREVFDNAQGLMKAWDKKGMPLNMSTEQVYQADTRFFKAAEALAATPLAALRKEGLQTAFTDGSPIPPAPFCSLLLELTSIFPDTEREYLIHPHCMQISGIHTHALHHALVQSLLDGLSPVFKPNRVFTGHAKESFESMFPSKELLALALSVRCSPGIRP